MDEKKVIKALVINSGLCDVRNIQESALAGYDNVVIKADILLSDPRSSEILNRYPVLYNVNSILNTAEEVAVSSVNGRMEIKPGSPAPGKRTYLVVNGLLEVAPGAEDALQGYCGFSINGTVICPASLSGYFTGAKINGLLDTYPDDCIRLKRTAVLDSTFPLRARQGGDVLRLRADRRPGQGPRCGEAGGQKRPLRHQEAAGGGGAGRGPAAPGG